MQLDHRRDSKPLLTDFNVLSLGEVSCLDPYQPQLGVLLARIHWLLLFMYAPATTTLPARQHRLWVSSRLGNWPSWVLPLSLPGPSPTP